MHGRSTLVQGTACIAPSRRLRSRRDWGTLHDRSDVQASIADDKPLDDVCQGRIGPVARARGDGSVSGPMAGQGAGRHVPCASRRSCRPSGPPMPDADGANDLHPQVRKCPIHAPLQALFRLRAVVPADWFAFSFSRSRCSCIAVTAPGVSERQVVRSPTMRWSSSPRCLSSAANLSSSRSPLTVGTRTGSRDAPLVKRPCGTSMALARPSRVMSV